MRAALYSRVSTRGKGQETANQLEQLRTLCTARTWEIVAEYEDYESASKSDRAQFQALLHSARNRRFDVVVFWALDRFTPARAPSNRSSI